MFWVVAKGLLRCFGKYRQGTIRCKENPTTLVPFTRENGDASTFKIKLPCWKQFRSLLRVDSALTPTP